VPPAKAKHDDSIWQTVKTIYVTYNPFAHQKNYAKAKPKNNSTPRFPGQPFQLQPLQDRDAVVSIFYQDLEAELLDEMDSCTQELLEKLAKSVKPRPGHKGWKIAVLTLGLFIVIAVVALSMVMLL
jgi:restriction endonuclease Mrr